MAHFLCLPVHQLGLDQHWYRYQPILILVSPISASMSVAGSVAVAWQTSKHTWWNPTHQAPPSAAGALHSLLLSDLSVLHLVFYKKTTYVLKSYPFDDITSGYQVGWLVWI